MELLDGVHQPVATIAPKRKGIQREEGERERVLPFLVVLVPYQRFGFNMIQYGVATVRWWFSVSQFALGCPGGHLNMMMAFEQPLFLVVHPFTLIFTKVC